MFWPTAILMLNLRMILKKNILIIATCALALTQVKIVKSSKNLTEEVLVGLYKRYLLSSFSLSTHLKGIQARPRGEQDFHFTNLPTGKYPAFYLYFAFLDLSILFQPFKGFWISLASPACGRKHKEKENCQNDHLSIRAKTLSFSKLSTRPLKNPFLKQNHPNVIARRYAVSTKQSQ